MVMTTAAYEPSGPQPEVRAAAGALRGSREAGVAVFRGIPYAEPPVGALRFAAPRRVEGWSGVREAVSYGPPPPQAGVFGMDALAQDAAGDDWLTLRTCPAFRPRTTVPVWISSHAPGRRCARRSPRSRTRPSSSRPAAPAGSCGTWCAT
ncbi:carboxylesterase family protein [Streptomyces sp. NPDC058304]|uniref:carboxylesterase family protein n=1 Tax=Streptomyces sp. NPDC058304 TaxID=3346437 RepID=UPI0036EB3BA0